MPGKPFQSKLNRFYDLIKKLRKEGLSYKQIAMVLKENHDFKVSSSSIHSFVKVRSKKRKVYEIKEVKIKPEIIGESVSKIKELEDVSTFDFSTFIKDAKSQPQASSSKFNYDEKEPIR